MAYVLRCIGFANMESPCSVAGQFVKTFDHEALGGHGYGTFTHDLKQAKKFASHGEAFLFWRRVPDNMAVRRDGKPNRPLTAMHMEILSLEAAMQTAITANEPF
jgi:hypothetical protein